MKPFRISHPASAEFADAVRWYEQKRTGLGAEFFDAVTQAIEVIRGRPDIGTRAGRTRSWLLSRFPYQVIYRVRTKTSTPSQLRTQADDQAIGRVDRDGFVRLTAWRSAAPRGVGCNALLGRLISVA